MSSRSADLYLADILESLEKIRHYAGGMSAEEFARDGKTIDAVLRNLAIIGEAASRLPSEVRAAYPHVPWQEIIGMRNKVVHEYFGVDEGILWKTIAEDLPDLADRLRRPERSP